MRASVVLAVLVLVAASLVVPETTEAKGPSRVERTFRGQIVVLKKRPPSRFPSQAAWIRFLRANRMKHIWPHKKYKKLWKFEFMAFFGRALDDVEVKVKFYDITDQKKFVAADSFYLPRRGQRIFASSVECHRDQFDINRKYVMYILTSRGKVLASTKFWLRAKGEVYSGRVEFSDEDAKLKR